jgi:2-dehydropantoate 2-reductase
MRILVVGVGGIGGYFGGRLAQAERDVTFLVRPARAARLAKTGLCIESPHGNYHNPAPVLVTADKLDRPFDLILLSCKAYDLASAIDSFAPAVGPATLILPLLNGMDHIDVLDARFGREKVLGGLCQISAGLDAEGRVQHFNDIHNLVFGDRDGADSARVRAVERAFSGALFTPRRSLDIVREMWEKWVFIAVCAGITCLMRSAVCDVIQGGGAGIVSALFDECAAIAAANGFPPGEALAKQRETFLLSPKSTLMASMLRDVECGQATEGEHILSALLERAERPEEAPVLALAAIHLRAYAARRARERG